MSIVNVSGRRSPRSVVTRTTTITASETVDSQATVTTSELITWTFDADLGLREWEIEHAPDDSGTASHLIMWGVVINAADDVTAAAQLTRDEVATANEVAKYGLRGKFLAGGTDVPITRVDLVGFTGSGGTTAADDAFNGTFS